MILAIDLMKETGAKIGRAIRSINFKVVQRYLIIFILIAIAAAVLYMIKTVIFIVKDRKEFTELSLPNVDDNKKGETKVNKFEGVKSEMILLEEDGIIKVDKPKIDILDIIFPEKAELPDVAVDKDRGSFEVVEPEITPIKEGIEIKTTEVHRELYDNLDDDIEELLDESRTSDYIDKDKFLEDLNNENTTEEDEFFDELVGINEKDD